MPKSDNPIFNPPPRDQVEPLVRAWMMAWHGYGLVSRAGTERDAAEAALAYEPVYREIWDRSWWAWIMSLLGSLLGSCAEADPFKVPGEPQPWRAEVSAGTRKRFRYWAFVPENIVIGYLLGVLWVEHDLIAETPGDVQSIWLALICDYLIAEHIAGTTQEPATGAAYERALDALLDDAWIKLYETEYDDA